MKTRTFLLAKLAVLAIAAASTTVAQTVTRVSISSSGVEADGAASVSHVSGDGRYVVFDSLAKNLVPGDTNGQFDVFLHDRETGVTERLSRTPAGSSANGHSNGPVISRDGRYVVYYSNASTLVAGDANGVHDVFRYDRATGVTELVSVSSAGVQGDDASWGLAAVSDDGGVVLFTSNASNLVAGDTNGVRDIFRRDLESGVTTRVSVSSAGAEGDGQSLGPAVSGDGRWAAFTSAATTLVVGDDNGWYDVFLHDAWTGTTERLATTGQWWGTIPTVFLSSDASQAAIMSAADLAAGDGDGTADVYVLERATGAFTRVSLASDGGEVSDPVFVTGLTPDARFVLLSTGGALVPGDTNDKNDGYLLDRDLDGDGVLDEPGRRGLVRATVNAICGQGWGSAVPHGAADDGTVVSFVTPGALLPEDTNNLPDAFVWSPARLTTVGTPSGGSPFGFALTGVDPAEAGNLAVVGLSCTGAAGILLSPTSQLLPLTLDGCTLAGLKSLALFSAAVDAAGAAATPTFAFPPLVPGVELIAAAVTVDAGTGGYRSITAPIGFRVQ